MIEALTTWPRVPLGVTLVLAGAAMLTCRLVESSSQVGPNAGRSAKRAVRFDIQSWRWHLGTAVLGVAALLLVSFTFDDYGYNIDEAYQAQYGVAIADWWGQRLAGEGLSEFVPRVDAMKYYGGLFELIAEVAARVSPLEGTATRHLVTAWLGVIGLGGAAWLGCLLHSRAAGFLTALLLLLTPRFYGHFFANPKDLPFAVCTTFMLVALCGALPSLPRISLGRGVAIGFAIGACMGIRVAGVLGLAYLGVALAWWVGSEFERRREGEATRVLETGNLLRLAASAVGVAALGWLVMLAAWPWAQSEPMARPLEALGFFQSIPRELEVDFPVLFAGGSYPLGSVPSRYSVQWLAISLPDFWLLVPVVGWALAVWGRRRREGWPNAREMAWVLVAISILAPLVAVVVQGVVQFDGIRHFLFILPGLTVGLSASLVEFLVRIPSRIARVGVLTALVCLSVLALLDMRALHPYQYVYFNRGFAGGLTHAAERYETDYLGLSYREGMRWLFEHRASVARTEEDVRLARPLRIGGCAGFLPNLVDALRQDPAASAGFKIVLPPLRPDVVLAFTRTNCHRRYSGRILASIDRMGVPLLYILDPRGAPARRR